MSESDMQGMREQAYAQQQAVHHPKHYNSHPSGVEAIEVVEHFSFNLGNAAKYLWRAGLKGKRQEDLAKALWYVEREHRRFEHVAPQAHRTPTTVPSRVERLIEQYIDAEANVRVREAMRAICDVSTGAKSYPALTVAIHAINYMLEFPA